MNQLKLLQMIVKYLGIDEETNTISINANNLALKDPFLELNTAEIGPGITAEDAKAGIRIHRGEGLDPVEIYYSESDGTWITKIGEVQKIIGLTSAQLLAIEEIIGNEANLERMQLMDTINYMDL